MQRVLEWLEPDLEPMHFAEFAESGIRRIKKENW
jgi:hypothetical protein